MAKRKVRVDKEWAGRCAEVRVVRTGLCRAINHEHGRSALQIAARQHGVPCQVRRRGADAARAW
ncbi:hypothetical protein A0H81_14179 [Grifola frondosa]|uniref:Uncharacterized protein n=1 Tax=Grifola frondosa TaxID=5627 RepID=A0A1C7LM77_GRIFR|nr:hypothetical protein A0H81_14179 [Grifola frondosa]